ncbi:neurofilament heavy polypeptide-like [Carica papaya]|uniref:neurofilament heavy polypeptide-like n=1 Tax=Carica papaya TaxID=3649 RepID=UPI000B8C8E54|nr:neurofilament heavy polypeptide-like [Carica papaya]
MSIALSESQLSFIDSPSFLKLPRGSKATECNSPYAEKSLSESNKMLTEEVERLKAEARNLETQCHLGNQKIQECQRQIEETWLLAKEEASKLKAAKEVIKALALRLHTMKGKVSSTKTGIDVSSPRTKLVDRKSPSLEHPMPVATRVPSDVKSPKQRKMDNVTDASLPITKLVERKSPSLEHPMPVATRVPSDVKSPKERQMDNVTDASLPITKLVDRKSPSLEHPMPVATRVPSDAKSPKERQTDNSCLSPIISSGKLHSMRGNTICHENSRSLETSLATATEPPQNVSKASKLEWVEQYEPGVYVTFTTLPSGQKGLKRVRFSRKRFTEKEAGKWWEDNQGVVYQKYGIDGYTGSNQNQMRS